MRVPFADNGLLKVPSNLPDEKVREDASSCEESAAHCPSHTSRVCRFVGYRHLGIHSLSYKKVNIYASFKM